MLPPPSWPGKAACQLISSTPGDLACTQSLLSGMDDSITQASESSDSIPFSSCIFTAGSAIFKGQKGYRSNQSIYSIGSTVQQLLRAKCPWKAHLKFCSRAWTPQMVDFPTKHVHMSYRVMLFEMQQAVRSLKQLQTSMQNQGHHVVP